MAELTLLVNSTDTALLGGSAVSPVAPNNAAVNAKVGRFAGVLSQQLVPDKGSVATESPPQNIETQNTQVLANGEPRPLNGKVLPLTTTQNATQAESKHPVMDASLLSAIAQTSPAMTGQLSNGLANSSSLLPTDPALAKLGGALPSTLPLPSLVTTHAANKNSAQTLVPNPGSLHSAIAQQTMNLQAVKATGSNATAVLPNAAQDAHRSVVTPIIPTLLGKPISVSAEQTLARIRGTGHGANGIVNVSGTETSLASRLATAQTQNNNLSNMPVGMSHLMGSTMRTDIFNAAIGAVMQGRAESPLPPLSTNSVTTTPALLMASTILPDSAINVSADAPRLLGTATPTLAVATPVGQPAWASEMGQRVIWLANNEMREAQLQLHPRNLGAVDVRITFGPEQQLNVNFNVTNPIARDALEASLPRLREMLEQQGLSLADANISQESPEEREQRNNMSDELSTQAALQASDKGVSDEVEVHPPLRWLSEGMLDAYA